MIHLVNKLNNISLAAVDVTNRLNSVRAHGNKDMEGQFAVSLRYPTEEPEKSKPARLFCCLMWCKADCQGEKFANAIDRKSRFVFPLCFVIFNAVYWYLYTNLHQDITTKYNIVDPYGGL